MTPDRFQTLVEAYGADARRWPDAERDTARAWAAQHPVEANAVLEHAAALDGWLDADRLAPMRAELIDRIVASAPKPAPWMFWRRPRLQWSGVAIAGVGVGFAGGIAGAFAVSFFLLTTTPSPMHDASSMATGFGSSTSEWSDE
jgi:hypothetical protein